MYSSHHRSFSPWLLNPSGRAVGLPYLIQQEGDVRHSLLNIPDHSLFVDQVGYPALPVKLADGVSGVGYQGEGDAGFRSELPVGLEIVGAYAQDLGVEAFEFLQIFLESLQFIPSSRN